MEIFREKVLEVVMKIPKGKTLTYKEVAKRAGSPKAARAVGNILHTNHDHKIPCHRVIRSDGKIGGYNRGIKNKKKILLSEGWFPSPKAGRGERGEG
jgi:O-6-methylguanine DNA methyltransferase